MNIKDNRISLLEEDLWCVHKYLDEKQIPRADDKGEVYSIVGRIKKMENGYLKQLGDLETHYMKLLTYRENEEIKKHMNDYSFGNFKVTKC